MTSNGIAGAPICWGVCEVSGWRHQLSPCRVLSEMRERGPGATELGHDGFLPREAASMARVLAEHGLTAVGGFTPIVLHGPDYDPAPEVDRILDRYAAFNASVLVLSALTGRSGYDSRPVIDEDGWTTPLANLNRLSARAAERGTRAVLHPHGGTDPAEGPVADGRESVMFIIELLADPGR
jgi:inosose dehydratase